MAETKALTTTGDDANPVLGERILTALNRGDIGLALGVVGILVVLILPLPRWLMDVSLTISITFSVLILMTALFINRPLEFNSFPMVLLLATMLRLSDRKSVV